jgi:integral membrane sensor domain MASE1
MSSRRFPPPRLVGGIGRLASAKNGQVTLLVQASGIDSKRKMPMTLVLVMVFNILVALALGFVFGRIYQIRRHELE